MITYLTISVLAAIIGVTWTFMLTTPGDVLDFWPLICNKLTKSTKILKILYACHRCIAGQVALWSGFFFQDWSPQMVIYHICSIFMAIYLSNLLGKLEE